MGSVEPAGRESEWITTLLGWMTAGGLVIWLAVVGLAIYATYLKSEPISSAAARRLVVWGGAILPMVILTALPPSTRGAPERPLHLWGLAAAPTAWALHFLLSYGTAAVWCAKVVDHGGSLAGARLAIAVYTVAALAAIAAIGSSGQRRHRLEGAPPPHDDDTPQDRHRFLGLATALLAGLSAVATVYSALAVAFFRSCR